MDNGQVTATEAVEALVANGVARVDAVEQVERFMETEEKLRSDMAPPESLHLPGRLEAARWEWGIPDRAFDEWPLDDRIYVYRPPGLIAESFDEGGLLAKPDSTKARERSESCEGILVAWGLKAQDELFPYGIELGMRISIIQMAPWMKPIGRDLFGREDHVLVLRAGHVIGSKTTEMMRRSSELKIKVTVHATERGTSLVTHTINGIEKQQPMVLEDY